MSVQSEEQRCLVADGRVWGFGLNNRPAVRQLITVRYDVNTPDHMPKKLQHDMRYVKGQEVMVFNLDGSIAGTAVIASYNMKNGNYRVWFQYQHANEQELIELPASMLAELVMQRM